MQAGPSQNPHFQRLNTLFLNEDKTDNSVKIWGYLCEFPEAVNCLFIAERNILHMAVLKKKVLLVKKLLEQHPELIAQHDKTQQLAFHHAMVAYDEEILSMLIEAAPDLIDAQRNDGRTALHLAVYSHVLPAIQQLIKAKANIYIQDSSGTSPYALAKESLVLFKSMCAWGTLIYEPKVAASSSQPIRTVDELSKKFALLNINPLDQSAEPPSVYEAKNDVVHRNKDTATLIPLSDVINGDMIKLQQYLDQGSDPDAKYILDRPLILSLFLKATATLEEQNRIDQLQGQKFLHLAKFALLSQTDRSGRNILEYLEHHTPAKVQLLKETHSQMQACAGRLMLNYTRSINDIGEEFINILLFAGLHKLKLANKGNQSGLAAKPAPTNRVDLIDELCTGVTPYNQGKTFNAEYVSNMTYGILSGLTVQEILAHLKARWPDFNLEQKLIANFMVKEIMTIDFVKDYHQVSKADIEFILAGNEEAFPLHAPKMNAFFDNIFNFRDMLLGHPIYRNCQFLLKWQNENVHDAMPSFYDLIKEAANLSRKQRKPLIKQIAAEFSSLSCNKFTSIHIEEFYNKAWSGSRSGELSPNIIASIQMTNDLVNYIKEIIVSAKDIHEAGILYELFVNVAAELCCSKNPSGPDMACVLIIMGALNTSDVNRLRKAFGEFDRKVEKKIDLLNKLIKPSKNYTWLRQTELAHQLFIPYLGKLLTDITFIYDGNENWSIACEMLGMKFKKLIEQQARVLAVPVVQTTDLTHLLKTHLFASEERIHEISTKLVPPVITIDSYSLSQLLFTINNYVNEKVIPNVNYNGKSYTAHHIVAAIFAQLKKQLLKEKESETFDGDVVKARKMMGDLILLVNARNPEITLNYLSYAFQLHEIRAQSTPTLEVSEQVAPIIYGKVEKSASMPETQDKRASMRNSSRL